MDRKSLIILVVSFAMLMLWYPLTNRLFPPTPLPHNTNQVTNGLSLSVTNSASSNAAEAPVVAPAARPEVSVIETNAPEQTVAVENKDARYTFTSRAGGVKFVELKKYPATIDCRNQNAAAAQQLATLNASALHPFLAIFDGELEKANTIFALTNTLNGIRAERVLPNGLHLVKEFQTSTNYLLKAVVRLENRTPAPITIPPQEWIVGTAAPLGTHDESMNLGVEWYDGSQAKQIDQAWFANKPVFFMPGTPRSVYPPTGNSNVVWAAVRNQFFTVILVPEKPAPAITVRKFDLPPPTPEQLATGSRVNPHPFGYEAALVYPAATFAPNQVIERRFDIYAGLKEYNTLARLGNNLDLVMGFSGFFGFFAKALLLSMNGLHAALALPYGVAIIVITVVIKSLFWPLTKASTRSMKRMQELQPQMKALQEKYKDDPRKMNAKLMEFMREHKVSPLGGCLPMLLQIPVFFGFYRMLQSAIELRGAHFLWACDLSQPDTVWMIPGLNFPVNPLPLLMGATMLWQARLTPASPGMDPVQQKMMKYMPLMFMVFLYSFSAGLTLYWTVQNLLTIAQMKLTRSSDSATASTKTPSAPVKNLAPKKKK